MKGTKTHYSLFGKVAGTRTKIDLGLQSMRDNLDRKTTSTCIYLYLSKREL